MSQFAYDYESQKLKKYNENSIQEENFARWSKENFYRTSYISHFTEVKFLHFLIFITKNLKKPLQPKNVAIPGYTGFIPGLYANNEYSKTYSRITRERLANPELGKNPLSLSSTGFNHKKHNFIDPTRNASTHKYGAQTMLSTHPCLDVNFHYNLMIHNFSEISQKKSGRWISQNKETYSDFRSTLPPTDQFFKTTNPVTTSSGFKKNHEQFDGKGWKPHRVLDG